jgi:hypothetical protein
VATDSQQFALHSPAVINAGNLTRCSWDAEANVG